MKVNRSRKRKLEMSTAPTKAKSREPSYSQAYIQNNIDRHRIRSRKSGRQTGRQIGRQSDGHGGWCLELGRGWRYGEEDESELDLLKSNVLSLE